MLKYYKKTLINLFSKVQVLNANPIENSKLCLQIQETLVKRITYVERQIRILRSEADGLRNTLRNPNRPRQDKEITRTIAERIALCNQQIEEYKDILSVLRQVGNAIAFSYIDKWDIKALANRDSAGFISGKKGLKRELSIMRTFFAHGQPAILNDITNCLRYGDLTLPVGDTFQIVEVKTSKHDDERLSRQIDSAEKLFKYFRTDRTSGLYGLKSEVRRIGLWKDEVNCRRQANQVINETLEFGKSIIKVEEGLWYLALFPPWKKNLEILREDFSFTGKIVMSLGDLRFRASAYYPLILSITNPDILYRFFKGDLFLAVLVDRESVRQRVESFGLRLLEGQELIRAEKMHNVPENAVEEKNWRIGIASEEPISQNSPLYVIGSHLLFRVFAEFLSLDWFIETQCEAFKTGEIFSAFTAEP